MKLVDLSPTVRGGHALRPTHPLNFTFEKACDFVDQRGPEPFSFPQLFRACWDSGAARQLIKAYLALGFIERISEAGARPVFYRVLPHALPKGMAA